MKPGYKTTEFYGVLASAIVTILVLLNVLEAGDHEDLSQTITNTFTGAAVAVANAAIVIQYIKARTDLKHQQADQDQVEAFADRHDRERQGNA